MARGRHQNEDWLAYVDTLIARQLPPARIVELARKQLGCARATGYRLIDKCYERMTPLRREQHAATVRHIMREAIDEGDHGAAIKAAQELARTYRLHEDRLHVEVAGQVQIAAKPDLSMLTDAELDLLESLHVRALKPADADETPEA